MGCRRWFSFPVLSHAGQIVQAFVSSGPIEGTPQFAERHDHYDALYVGRERR